MVAVRFVAASGARGGVGCSAMVAGGGVMRRRGTAAFGCFGGGAQERAVARESSGLELRGGLDHGGD